MGSTIDIIIYKMKNNEKLTASEKELVLSILERVNDAKKGGFEKKGKLTESLNASGKGCPCCGEE